jgi:hypothetical protein
MDTSYEIEGPARGPEKAFYCDWSFWSLIIWNLVAIVWAVADDWSFKLLIAVYLCQSLIMGFFWFLRVCSLKDFYVQGGEQLSMEKSFHARSHAAIGFLFTYSFFQLFALLFVAEVILSGRWPLLVMVVSFFISQWSSLSKRPVWISDQRPNLDIMAFPLVRILPMFVPLFFFGTRFGEKLPMAVFLLAKTFADAGMHAFEYNHFGDTSHPERLFTDHLAEESQKCELCQCGIDSSGARREIKGHVFCKECYDKIQYAKAAND